jgi:hypothetical protein
VEIHIEGRCKAWGCEIEETLKLRSGEKGTTDNRFLSPIVTSLGEQDVLRSQFLNIKHRDDGTVTVEVDPALRRFEIVMNVIVISFIAAIWGLCYLVTWAFSS